jgi:hypothetical protein
MLPEPAKNPSRKRANSPYKNEVEDEVDARRYPQAECVRVSIDCNRSEHSWEYNRRDNDSCVSKEQRHLMSKADREKSEDDSDTKCDKHRPTP